MAQRPHHVNHFIGRSVVKIRRGFIGQYQFWICGQSSCHRSTLFLSAGNLTGQFIALVEHPDRFE